MTRSRLLGALIGAAIAIILGSTVILGHIPAQMAPATADLTFKMVHTAVVASCLPHAAGKVAVTQGPRTEQMTIHVAGLYAKSTFTVFLLQAPTAPFGISVYEGDIGTDADGAGSSTFIGRFSLGSFAVAAGAEPAPTLHTAPFPDASGNPAFQPVHLLHLGIWFKTEQRAVAAGCGAVVTPFSPTHSAGIQVLNTSTYPITAGPLGQLK